MTEMRHQLYCDGLCAGPEVIYNHVKWGWKAYKTPTRMFAASISVF